MTYQNAADKGGPARAPRLARQRPAGPPRRAL